MSFNAFQPLCVPRVWLTYASSLSDTITPVSVRCAIGIASKTMHRQQKRSHRIAFRREGDIMKAAVAPAVSSSWQIKEVPQPQPGLNQVLVKMRASGICYTDVHETLG